MFLWMMLEGHSPHQNQIKDHIFWEVGLFFRILCFSVPGCFCLGFGRLVTHVWGHIRMLQGCRDPSRKCCLASDTWIPPRGVLGNVFAGTSAKQYKPTWWMLSIACGKACRGKSRKSWHLLLRNRGSNPKMATLDIVNLSLYSASLH